MKKDRRERPERAGFEVGDAADFLGLTEGERRELDRRVAEQSARPTPGSSEWPRPAAEDGRSPLDVSGVDTGVGRDEILESLRESRRRLVSDEDEDDRT